MNSKGKTYLYIYRLAVDTGLAPCIDNGLLTLACCKGGQIRNGKPCNTGLRYKIGTLMNSDNFDKEKDSVYVIGTYKDKLLYLARITDAVEMTEYYNKNSKYSAKGRLDNLYTSDNGELVRNKKLEKENVHTDKEQQDRDKAGKYVLVSEDFSYFGKNAVKENIVSGNYKGAKRQETKSYFDNEANEIINICKAYNKICKTPNDNYLKKGCKVK